jgi:hypothetical protein
MVNQWAQIAIQTYPAQINLRVMLFPQKAQDPHQQISETSLQLA